MDRGPWAPTLPHPGGASWASGPSLVARCGCSHWSFHSRRGHVRCLACAEFLISVTSLCPCSSLLSMCYVISPSCEPRVMNARWTKATLTQSSPHPSRAPASQPAPEPVVGDAPSTGGWQGAAAIALPPRPWTGGCGSVPAPLCTPASPSAECREGWLRGSSLCRPPGLCGLFLGVPGIPEVTGRGTLGSPSFRLPVRKAGSRKWWGGLTAAGG